MRFERRFAKRIELEHGRITVRADLSRRVPGVKFATCSIVLTFVLVSLLLCVFVDRTMSDAKRAAESAALTKATLVAKSYASYLSERASSVDLLARTVAFEFERTNGELDLKHLVDEGLIIPSEETLVTLVDGQGIVNKSWPTSADHKVHLTDREHFVVQKNSVRNDLFISVPVVGRVSRETTIQFTRRLSLPNDSFAGIVVVSQPPKFFTRTFANHANLGTDGELVVFRSDGAQLASATGDGKATSSSVPLALYPESNRTNLIHRDPVDQHARLFVRQPVPGLPLIAVIALSANDIYADYEQRRIAYWGWAALLIFAMAVAAQLGIFASRRVLLERARMLELAETDALTGLTNRRGLDRYIRTAATELKEHFALVLVDIAGFAGLDTRHGADAADQMLEMVAQRLRSLALHNELIARVRDHHFAAAFKHREPEARALAFVRSVIEAFGRPVQFHGKSEIVKLSIGIATASAELAHTGELQARAECALALANRAVATSDRSEYRVYEQWMADIQGATADLEAELDYAVRQRAGIVPGFSPIKSVSLNRITGLMVDPMWSRNQDEHLSAEEFMSTADKLGLTKFIWTQTIEAASRALHATDGAIHQLTVRVPYSFIADGDAAKLMNSGLVVPGQLHIALTGLENQANLDSLVEKTQELRARGAAIYLVLDAIHILPAQALARLTIDGLVIEGSSLHSLATTNASSAFVGALVSTAATMGWKVIVGPIDHQSQWDWLSGHLHVEAWGSFVGVSTPVDPPIA
ncbi:sensor domain-containing diguanylate cyclase [Burkholderia stagnalis]|nr:sensor domain-containing diguanylate cyclase [Burkholderia stagnalis]RQY68743.1 sensor domain-containing diguanylate cyclase [Burkholderia stagnalis]